MGVDRAPRVRVVAFAVARKLLHLCPSLPLVATGPHHNFAAGTIWLRTWLRRRNNSPRAVFNVQRTEVVIVIACCERSPLPGMAGPVCREPLAWVVCGARREAATGQVKDYGSGSIVEVNVLEIDKLML